MYWRGSRKTLFSALLFLSAFLVFSIQPMIGKYLLPYFGGSSAVWGATLLFFTTALFASYVYADTLARLVPEKGIRVYTYTIVGVCVAMLCTTLVWQAPFPPQSVFSIATAFPPFMQVLIAITLSVGIPYLLLATTAPLLQHLYYLETNNEPYWLYAVSNIGSFVALGGYVFVIERFLPLAVQGWLWLCGCIAYAALLTYILRTTHARSVPPLASAKEAPVPYYEYAVWIFLSALATFLLTAVTTEITQTISPVPLLWVLPLALYLATFVIAFAGYAPRGLTIPFALFAIVCAYGSLWYSIATSIAPLASGIALLLLFAGALYCHGQLYDRRPKAHTSSRLYVASAFGGAVGVFSASVLPPLLFTDYFEYEIGIAVLASALVVFAPRVLFPKELPHAAHIGIQVMAVAYICIAGYQHYVHDPYETPSYQDRSFYGVVRIRDYPDEALRTLSHGNTVHGMQYTDERALQPNSYYTAKSGVAVTIDRLRTLRSNSTNGALRVGVIGLGTGTLAAYCKANDEFVFFEIDPRIHTIATTQFTYLASCENSTVRIGDARIVLEEAARTASPYAFDVLVLDAFTDDTIPTHLLTKEAFSTYTQHLAPNGVIAAHLSNRYLNLAPVVLRTSAATGLTPIVYQAPLDGSASYSTTWVLASQNDALFKKEKYDEAAALLSAHSGHVWTDQYADIVGALYTAGIPEYLLGIFYDLFLKESDPASTIEDTQ